MFKVLERIFRDKIATEQVSFTGSPRFRGKLAGRVAGSLLTECQAACPVGAFQVREDKDNKDNRDNKGNKEGKYDEYDKDKGDSYQIDYRRCIFCGRCVEACARGVLQENALQAGAVPETALQESVLHEGVLHEGTVQESAGAEAALHHSSEDVMPYLLEAGQEAVAEVLKQRLGRSLHVRHLDAGSCNACDFEMGALGNPYYDLHRYGVAFVASPRHADMLMVTGVVTRNLEQALRMSYEAMPEPRLVMACGACAAGGETYGDTYAIVGAADKVVPVDIYVPGCPPRPSAMIAGLLAAADMLKERMKK